MSFPLVDNERVKGAVGNMLASATMPHALLIEGEEGYGKSTLARYLCGAALCEGEGRPCGVCDSCRLLESGNHPDFTLVAPESGKTSIPISAVREIISYAAVLPHKSQHKVFLIDNADLLTPQAQNALLKVLEEPPKSVVFVLTAVSRSAMLPTVVSRCSVLTLCAPEESAAADYIVSAADCTKEDALAALKEARGSIGKALEILSKSDDNTAYITAKAFVDIMQNKNRYDLLKLLLPLEKKRKETAQFYDALEIMIVSIMKQLSSPTLVRRYEKLYDLVLSHKKLLKSNANLSLLLTALAMAAKER